MPEALDYERCTPDERERMLHEGGWTASGDADAEITFTSPIGRTIRSRAGPVAA